MENIKAIIEALIFASDTPLTLEKICVILEGIEKSEVKRNIDS